MVHEHDALLQKSLLPPADEVAGMYVMFSVRSVILFGGGEVPCDHYPWCIGTHHAGTPPQAPQTSLYRDTLVLTSGGYWRTYRHLVVTEEHTVDKQAICILLEYFLVYLPPATTFGQGYIFTGVCDFCSQGGGLPQCILGYPLPRRHPPLGKQTPPLRTAC